MLNQTNKHVLMAALAYNLKKYMKYAQKTRKAIALATNKTIENALFSTYSDLLLNNFHFFRKSKQIFLLN
jgi:hypothetical protein